MNKTEHRRGWCSSNILDLYSGGIQFESWLSYHLFWLRLFKLFFNFSRLTLL